MRKFRIFFPILAAILSTSGTQPIAPARAESVQAGDITVDAAWTRATLGAAANAAGYMTLTNASDDPDHLVGITSPRAGKVTVHLSDLQDGVMRMRPLVGPLTIAGGATIHLVPRGMHLMMVGIKGPFEEGQLIPLTLRFAKAGRVDIELTVEPAGSIRPSPTRERANERQTGHGSH